MSYLSLIKRKLTLNNIDKALSDLTGSPFIEPIHSWKQYIWQPIINN